MTNEKILELVLAWQDAIETKSRTETDGDSIGQSYYAGYLDALSEVENLLTKKPPEGGSF